MPLSRPINDPHPAAPEELWARVAADAPYEPLDGVFVVAANTQAALAAKQATKTEIKEAIQQIWNVRVVNVNLGPNTLPVATLAVAGGWVVWTYRGPGPAALTDGLDAICAALA